MLIHLLTRGICRPAPDFKSSLVTKRFLFANDCIIISCTPRRILDRIIRFPMLSPWRPTITVSRISWGGRNVFTHPPPSPPSRFALAINSCSRVIARLNFLWVALKHTCYTIPIFSASSRTNGGKYNKLCQVQAHTSNHAIGTFI